MADAKVMAARLPKSSDWKLYRKITPARRVEKSKLILKYAREAKSSFEAQCNASRRSRSKSGGALTHAEQDLLRAMLVFAGAGLDACLKQLVRDALGYLV